MRPLPGPPPRNETIQPVDIANIIQTIAIYALPVLFAITVHEAAHGYVARHYGDGTAAFLGRVTLNPLKHIDPIGTIAMPLFLYVATAGSFLFGYAKPVPVNFGNLRNPKRDMIWVALAGPASNFIMALGWAIGLIVLAGLGVQERFFVEMCRAGVLVNVVMFALNMFPLLHRHGPDRGGRALHAVDAPGDEPDLRRAESAALAHHRAAALTARRLFPVCSCFHCR